MTSEAENLDPFTGADMRERFVRYFNVQTDRTVWTGKASIHAVYADYCGRSNVEPEPEALFFKNIAAMFGNDPWSSDRHHGVVHLSVDDVEPLRVFNGCGPFEGPSFAVLPSEARPRRAAF